MSGSTQVKSVHNVHGWDQANVFSKIDGSRFITLFNIRANVLKAKHDVFIKISTGRDCLTDNPLESYSREGYSVLLPEDLQVEVASVFEELKSRSIYDLSSLTLIMQGFGEVSYNPYAPLLFKWVKGKLGMHSIKCEQLIGSVSTIAPRDNPRFDRFLLDMQSVSFLLDKTVLTVIIGPSSLSKRELVYNSNVMLFDEIDSLISKCCKGFNGDLKILAVEEDLRDFRGDNLRRFTLERYKIEVKADSADSSIYGELSSKFPFELTGNVNFVSPEDFD